MLKIQIQESSPTSVIFQYMKGTVILVLENIWTFRKQCKLLLFGLVVFQQRPDSDVSSPEMDQDSFP